MSIVRRVALSLLAVAAASCARPDSITPADLRAFTSDGCSRFPNGTYSQKNLWCSCCVAHDRVYWAGGTEEQRLAADQELKRCVTGVNQPEIAEAMLRGVRVGGSPYWPTSFRWGYGWPYFRGYKPLSPDEQVAVRAKLSDFEAKRVELLTCVE